MNRRILPTVAGAVLAAGAAAQLQVSQLSTSGPPVTEFASAHDSVRGRTLLFGGDRLGVLRNEMWEWDGASWTVVPTLFPGPRGRPALGFDAARGRAVMFGGVTAQSFFLADTWTWDGAAWQQQAAAPAPSVRSGAAMAYDPVRQVVVLFGGFVPTGADSQETWEWNGAAWAQRTPSLQPPPRGAHRMVYDAGRGTVVMFGGWRTPLAGTVGDTWEWNGTAWTTMTAGFQPPNRCDQAMVFDEGRGRTVMFGGLASFQQPGNVPVTLGDWWVLGPNGWQSRTVAGSPTARTYVLGEYDRANAEVVLHGGFVAGVRYTDTFRVRTATPAAMTPYGAGCVGTNGVPALSPDSLPWLDDYYQVSVANVPTTTLGFLAIGFSDTVWNGLSVPVDLSTFGLPGCQAWLGPDLSVAFTVQNGVGSWGLQVCNCPAAIGLSYSLQAIVLDAGVSRPLGASASNALRATIGAW